MDSNDSESDNDFEGWSNLETNKTFEGVDEETSKWIISKHSLLTTDEVDGLSGSKRRSLSHSFSQTTPYSLLVQSLIKQLCHFVETDKDKSTQLYNKICAKLFEMKFIDESFEKSEFENIRMSYEIALKQLFEVTRGNSLPVQDIEVWPLNHENPKTALEWSRYYRDFEEIEKIGEGGFGNVWKSKHKLDQIEYAIKKICVKATSVKNILNHLREVKTLASLNHVNIVPYKSCWLEPLISYHQEDKMIDASTNQSSSDESSNFTTESNYKDDSLRLKSESFSIDFQYSQEQISVEKTFKSASKSFSTFDNHSRLEKIRQLNEGNATMIPHVKLTWAVLYIQMKLCQKTLRNFLDERNEHSTFGDYYQQFPSLLHKAGDLNSNNTLTMIAFGMFQQICHGLEYIHAKEIVHHDIKPSNVFISTESGLMTLQLGDFGLACPLENNDMVRHDGFGTRLYASSEQLAGVCNKKSDIYSLGVILIELLSKNITVMECFKNVEKLKKGDSLPEIEAESCDLIRRLLSHDTVKRPSIGELRAIVQIKLDSASNEIDILKKVISDKDNVIHQKDQQIDELQNEIKKLRKQLSNTEV